MDASALSAASGAHTPRVDASLDHWRRLRSQHRVGPSLRTPQPRSIHPCRHVMARGHRDSRCEGRGPPDREVVRSRVIGAQMRSLFRRRVRHGPPLRGGTLVSRAPGRLERWLRPARSFHTASTSCHLVRCIIDAVRGCVGARRRRSRARRQGRMLIALIRSAAGRSVRSAARRPAFFRLVPLWLVIGASGAVASSICAQQEHHDSTAHATPMPA